MKLIRNVLLITVMLLQSAHCFAYTIDSCDNDVLDKEGCSFNWENDIGFTDESYTNGMLWQKRKVFEPCVTFSDTSKHRVPAYVAAQVSEDPIIQSKGDVFGFGITMYSPVDITASNVQLNDRPYSGLLYVSKGYQTNTLNRAENYEQTVLHNFSFGCIGPCAQQEFVQDKWHGLARFLSRSNSPKAPKGWDHQIKNEPAFIYTYDNRKTIYSSDTVTTSHGSYKSFEVTRIYKVLAGNIFDTLETGLLIRHGKITEGTHYTGEINKFMMLASGEKTFENPVIEKNAEREVYVFLRSQIRAILYNATLEGGLFDRIINDTVRSEHTVDARPATLDFEAGGSYTFKCGLVLDISVASRSTEFKEKKWDAFDHVWTEIKLAKMIDI